MERPQRNPPRRVTNPKGRIPHQPDAEKREKVRSLSAVGYNKEEIANYLGISTVTLNKWYADEFEKALPDLLSLAESSLKKGLRLNEAWATTFALKTKGKNKGWSERTEVTGKDGAPLIDLSLLSESELEQLERLQRKATINGAQYLNGNGNGHDYPNGNGHDKNGSK